jgi:hypothetical protein
MATSNSKIAASIRRFTSAINKKLESIHSDLTQLAALEAALLETTPAPAAKKDKAAKSKSEKPAKAEKSKNKKSKKSAKPAKGKSAKAEKPAKADKPSKDESKPKKVAAD